MKQHLYAEQLKELSYNNRITLLSLAMGLDKSYLRQEYKENSKDEEGQLRAYGFEVKVGDMIEAIEDYTEKFPIPEIEQGKYLINLEFISKDEETIKLTSEYQPTYCDALFKIIKSLFDKNIIY